jgi:hypothetical protein
MGFELPYVGDWIPPHAVSTGAGPVLHPAIHFFKKYIKIVMKKKVGLRFNCRRKCTGEDPVSLCRPKNIMTRWAVEIF